MKAVEFQSQLGPDQSLPVPSAIAARIPAGQPVRVLLLIGESEDDQEWEELAAVDLGLGFADSDAIYDQLSSR